jgi:hypothetical protein
MTDMTDLHVADTRRSQPLPRGEYMAYFALIFLATLVPATLAWALTTVRHMSLPAKGPIARAWTQARIITPCIFNA